MDSYHAAVCWCGCSYSSLVVGMCTLTGQLQVSSSLALDSGSTHCQGTPLYESKEVSV